MQHTGPTAEKDSARELVSLPKSALTSYAGALPPAKLRTLTQALRVALDIPD
jgi:hypothetical protein